MSELYDLSLDELLKGDATLLNKIERDMKVAKAENNVIKFVWISIVIGVVMIILGNVFDGNPFIDFISAALPWVLLGLMVLFAILYAAVNVETITLVKTYKGSRVSAGREKVKKRLWCYF